MQEKILKRVLFLIFGIISIAFSEKPSAASTPANASPAAGVGFPFAQQQEEGKRLEQRNAARKEAYQKYNEANAKSRESRKKMDVLEAEIEKCSEIKDSKKKDACKKEKQIEIDKYEDQLAEQEAVLDEARDAISEAGGKDPSEKLKTTCEDLYSQLTDEDNKDCMGLQKQGLDACMKKMGAKGNLLDSGTVKSLSPLLNLNQSLQGVGTTLEMYSTMNAPLPGCTLNKSDFDKKESDLKDSVEKITDRLNDITEKIQETHEAFAAKMKEWSRQQTAILEQIQALPGEKSQAQKDTENSLINAKVEAENKYNALVEGLLVKKNELNDLNNKYAIILKQTSDFAISDACMKKLEEAEQKKNPNGAKSNSNTGMSSLFSSGGANKDYRIKSYQSCMSVERKAASSQADNIKGQITVLTNRINTIEAAFGRLEEEKVNTNKKINDNLSSMIATLDTKGQKLKNEYDQLQAEINRETALYQNKLKSLESNKQAQTQKLAINNMKLQAFNGDIKPAVDGKSNVALINSCKNFESYDKPNFVKTCCKTSDYKGKGSGLCIEAKANKKEKTKKPSGKPEKAD